MRATSVPGVEAREVSSETRRPVANPESALFQQPTDGDDPTAAEAQADNIVVATVKAEEGALDSAPADPDADELLDGSATLRPAPPPSAKRRESEAALDASSEPTSSRPVKKQKRAVSPPWSFPTADVSTLKTADGRRISARHNTSTPGVSENEGGGRSLSQSVSRSRPVSPPWKRFAAEGPSAVQVDGKRKSGRVNKELTEIPKRVSPRNKRQVDKLSTQQDRRRKPQAQRRASGGESSKEQEVEVKMPNDGPETPSRSSSSGKKIADLRAQIAALQPTRSFSSTNHPKPAHKHQRSHDFAEQEMSSSPPYHRKGPKYNKANQSPKKSMPSAKIKLRFGSKRAHIDAPHPQAKMPSPARPPQLSLYHVMERYELKEMQQPFMDNERGPPGIEYFAQRAEKQAVEEGLLRQRLLREAESGGALSKDHLSLYQDERQLEPPQQYGHGDHLVAHALCLRTLQLREKAAHRLSAKKLAHEALEKWKIWHGPTEEDLIAEQTKLIELIRKQVVTDMKLKWELVEHHVQNKKKEAWEAEQERIRAKKLQEKLEWSENLLAKQRGDADDDSDLDENSTGDINDSSNDSEDDEAENMSESESEADGYDGEDDGEMDEDALAAYLTQRDVEPPDKAQVEETERDSPDLDVAMGRIGADHSGTLSSAVDVLLDGIDDASEVTPQPAKERTWQECLSHDMEPAESNELTSRPSKRGQQPGPTTKEQEEAEDHLSSDESTEMYDSDEDMSSTADEGDGNDDTDDDDESEGDDESTSMSLSLMALYSAKDLLQKKDGGLPTPVTSVENGGEDDNPAPDSEQRFDEHHEFGEDDAAMCASQLEVQSGLDTQRQDTPAEEPSPGEEAGDEEVRETSDEGMARTLVPTPTLLRGTLRSYQHAGLDWLASLYRNGTNGILADEMGLGKTIQTISLLAHLAEVHEVWETHLVIVPTSVILNWVTEFQKFLPGFRVLAYYGTAEERQQKRRGWTNDPHHEHKDKRGYNVVITSYNVAMQDINAIRNVQWHYLILDEAHNIRNFNSQRWQVLIRLRTRARLLLTGTPLQNDLAEVWSLLTFLTAGDDDRSHGELEEFLGHWKDPVKEIFDQGVQKISDNAQRVVDQLHISLRPFLLRRKKSEVEKDLPKKSESVVVCKLSKRQRQLYQDYMGLAETKATLAKGSGIQAGAVLLSLRRVCNHPDLFDPRPIQTSFALEGSPLESFEVKERLVRCLLGIIPETPGMLLVVRNEDIRRAAAKRNRGLAVSRALRSHVQEIEKVPQDASLDASTLSGSRALQRLRLRERRLLQLRASIRATESSLGDAPVYGIDLRELLTTHKERPYLVRSRRAPNFERSLLGWIGPAHRPHKLEHPADLDLLQSSQLQRDISTLDTYAERMQGTIMRFAFVPPAATAPILKYAIPQHAQEMLRSSPAYPTDSDWGHEARIRTSIAFPDSRLLIYDSGKLQRLVYLLRELQSKGSRSLIFTQMTGTLNILEQFLSLLNLPYLRLDGSTPVERRQLYSAEFNRPDSRYQCMILSSRAGGVGLNLTGASSVIFYDLDWNPQMDRQCMDRAHRIGQVRDVEVYKMVSEKTVEENILRRANQKSLLDEAVIQEGHFTTDHQQSRRPEEAHEQGETEVAAAIERLLGGEERTNTRALESVEDQEDVQAAQQAAKEDRQDDVDFAERSSKGPSKANTPGPGMVAEEEVDEERKGHVDLYMIKWMEKMWEGWRYVPAPVRKLDKHGRDPSHRPKRKR